ncbi:hypothetical protein FOA52_000842 [Chlamydomonas sp. UWO 241]|nr:hypothetical protein FOA52_000842 [Chlamydomonas sp. UWO 241]
MDAPMEVDQQGAFAVAQSVTEDLARCHEWLRELRACRPSGPRGGDAPQEAKARGVGDDARTQALEWQVAELAAALAAECSARQELALEHAALKSMLTKTYGQVVDDYLSATQLLRAKDKHIQGMLAAAAPSAERGARGGSAQQVLAAGAGAGTNSAQAAPPTQVPVQLQAPAHAPRAHITAHSDTGAQQRQDQQQLEPVTQRSTAGTVIGAATAAASGGGGAPTAGAGSAAAVLGGIERFFDGGWTTRTHGMRAAPAASTAAAPLPSAAAGGDAVSAAAAAAPALAGGRLGRATVGAQLPGSSSDDSADGIGGDGSPFLWDRLASVLGSSSSESDDLLLRAGGHNVHEAKAGQRERWEQRQQREQPQPQMWEQQQQQQWEQREQQPQKWERVGGSLLERMGLASHMSSDAALAHPSPGSSLQHGVTKPPSSATTAAGGHPVRVERGRGREYGRTASMPAESRVDAFGAPPGVAEWSTEPSTGAAQLRGAPYEAGTGAGGAPAPPASRAWQHPHQQQQQQPTSGMGHFVAGEGRPVAGGGDFGPSSASMVSHLAGGATRSHHDNPADNSTTSTGPMSGWRSPGGNSGRSVHPNTEPTTTASDQLFATIKGQLASLQEEWGVGPPAGAHTPHLPASSPPLPPQQTSWRHAAASAAAAVTTVPAVRSNTPAPAPVATPPVCTAGLLDADATSDLIWPTDRPPVPGALGAAAEAAASPARYGGEGHHGPRGFVVVGAGGVL